MAKLTRFGDGILVYADDIVAPLLEDTCWSKPEIPAMPQIKGTSVNNQDLHGTWKLVSLQSVMNDGGAPTDLYGADPVGKIVFTQDNLMMTVITAKDRSTSKNEAGDGALFRSMMAYSGPFRVEGGNQFITTVDVAWNPDWVGTEQVRTFSIEGDILSITTAEAADPVSAEKTGHGLVTWRKSAS